MNTTTPDSLHERVVVSGRLDIVAAVSLRAQLTELLDAGRYHLLVDLQGVDFVDSAGLAALVRAMKVARSNGGDVELVRPRCDDAFRVFKLTNFDNVFRIHPEGF